MDTEKTCETIYKSFILIEAQTKPLVKNASLLFLASKLFQNMAEKEKLCDVLNCSKILIKQVRISHMNCLGLFQ